MTPEQRAVAATVHIVNYHARPFGAALNTTIIVEAIQKAITEAVLAQREADAKIAELPPITDTILCGDTCDYIARAIRTASPEPSAKASTPPPSIGRDQG